MQMTVCLYVYLVVYALNCFCNAADTGLPNSPGIAREMVTYINLACNEMFLNENFKDLAVSPIKKVHSSQHMNTSKCCKCHSCAHCSLVRTSLSSLLSQMA